MKKTCENGLHYKFLVGNFSISSTIDHPRKFHTFEKPEPEKLLFPEKSIKVAQFAIVPPVSAFFYSSVD